MTTVLEVSELTVSYNGNYALDRVSFDVLAGERVAIVGPNGAGKSTLFKALLGMVHHQAGRVETNGAEFGYVTHRSAVDWSFHVTVHDVVMMGRVARMGCLRWQRPATRPTERS